MDYDLLDALEKLETITEANAVRLHLERAIQDFGYNTVACVKIPGPGEAPEDVILANTRPLDWTQRYIEENQMAHDPVVIELRHTATPFTWEEMLQRRPWQKQQKEVVLSARDFGMNSGLVVPIHIDPGYSAIVSYTSELSDVPERARLAARVFGMYAHAKLLDIRRQEDGIRHKRLSARERECMIWVAHGKSDEDIAEITGLTKATVHFYIERAKIKLDARNRVYAVVQALRRREINL